MKIFTLFAVAVPVFAGQGGTVQVACPGGFSGLYLAQSGTIPEIVQCSATGSMTIIWTAPQFADAVVPVGAVDGKNAKFTLSHAVKGGLILTRNGVVQKQYGDFMLSGLAVTFNPGAVPTVGDSLQAWYRY